MNRTPGRFIGGSALLSFCTISLCLIALGQQKTGSESEVQSGGTQTAAASPFDFEVKIDQGEFLVRRKGTLKWKKSSQFSEPIAIAFLEGDRKIYVATKAITPPKPIHTEAPDYPASERESRREGVVALHIVVDDHGAVRDPKVYAGPGPEFAKAAVEAVTKWTFQPADLNGQPVAVLTNVTMQFKLY
jgi:TonB family protein